jgi:hypothetical protein
MNKDFDLLHVRIVGFIGEHTLRDPQALANELCQQLKKMQMPGRQLLAISPLTGSADLLFAREALALSIHLVVALTLPREELRKHFPGASALEFDDILKKASRVETLLLSPQPDATTRLGQKLVDEADVILAVADDTGNAVVGDTREVIAYASRRGRSVTLLRETADGVEVREIKSELESPDANWSVEDLQAELGKAPRQPVIPEGLTKFFNACDKYATKTAPQVRRYVLNIVLANAVASMAGGVGSSFTHIGFWGTILNVIKFLCIGTSLWIFFELRHRQSRNHWLDLRLKAEVCRSAIATWNSPVSIEPVSSDQVPELRHLLQALRYFRATRPHAADISLEDFKASYAGRLVDQYRYFQKHATSAVTLSRLTPLCAALNGGALVLSFISIVAQSFYGHPSPFGTWTNFLFTFIPIAAPNLATWIVAWQAIESVSRKKARFVEMQKAMHQAMVDLVHCHSWETVQLLVKKTEKHLLSEVLEWYSFIKYS